MLQIKDKIEAEVKKRFKEELVYKIVEFLKESKEQLRLLRREKELRVTQKEPVSINFKNGKNQEMEEEDGSHNENEDYDDEDSFVAEDDERIEQELSEGEERDSLDDHDLVVNDDDEDDYKTQNLSEWEKNVIPGERDESENPLILFMIIMCDVFYSVNYIEEETHVLSRLSTGITEKRKIQKK